LIVEATGLFTLIMTGVPKEKSLLCKTGAPIEVSLLMEVLIEEEASPREVTLYFAIPKDTMNCCVQVVYVRKSISFIGLHRLHTT